MPWLLAGTLSVKSCGRPRPISEWLVRRLDPQPGDTVLELAAGLGDTALMAARLVGESGRVIITDFAPEMVAAARQRSARAWEFKATRRRADGPRDGQRGRCSLPLGLHADDPSPTRLPTNLAGRPAGLLRLGQPRAQPGTLYGKEGLESQGHIPPPEAPGPFAMADPGRIPGS